MPLVSGHELLQFFRNWDASTAVPALCAIFLVSRIVHFWSGLRAVSYWPGMRSAFGVLAPIGAALPSTWWNPGLLFSWKGRYSLYPSYGTDTISMVPFLVGDAQFFTANLDVAHQVVAEGQNSDWMKPLLASLILSKWGPNVAIASQEVWTRHRRILSPAFTVKTYQMVWEQTVAAYRDMVSYEGWSTKSVVDVPSIHVYTSKLTLVTFTACGFGIPTTWESASTVDATDGSATMSVMQALRIDQSAAILDLLPSWVMYLPTRQIRQVKAARRLLNKYMVEQVALRKAEVRQQLALGEESNRDTFSLLARANELEARNNKLTLSDREMIGNVYFLLLAGHETTAYSLSATFALLAANPDIQDKLYQDIIDTIGPDGEPVYEDYHKLDKVLATFYEGVRMFPAAYVVVREARNDTNLVVPGWEGKPQTILPIRKGTVMTVDMIGIQYNRRYFSDPHVFRPSRWHSGSNGEGEDAAAADLVTAFSFGPRNCLGRRFATTEAVAFLTLFLRDWALEPLLLPGETAARWKERVLDAKALLTLNINDVPLRLRRRKP